MSQAKEAIELAALIVEATYGELPSRIFATLLRRGRLPILSLAQSTRIPPRHLRHGIAVLIQQNLLYYQIDRESKVTYYEANQHAAHLLLRSGKIMELVRSRYSPAAEHVVRILLFLGHAKVGDLARASYSMSNPDRAHVNANEITEPSENGTSSTRKRQPQGHASEDLDHVLIGLLDAGLVEPVTKGMFQSPSDRYNEVERDILNQSFNGSTKGPKQNEELRSKIMERMRELRTERQFWERKANKRSSNNVYVSGGKRRKLANGDSSTVSESDSHDNDSCKLDPNLTIKINHEKCTVALRNQKLVSLAAREFGETTSRIYSALLGLLEDKTPRCQSDPSTDDIKDMGEGPAIGVLEITQALGISFNSARGIAKGLNDEGDTTLGGKKPALKRQRELENEESIVEGRTNSDQDEAEAIHVNGKGRSLVIDSDPDTGIEDPFAEPLVGATPVKPLARSTKVKFQDNLPKPALREHYADQMTQIRDHLLLLAEHPCPFVRKCGNREWTVDFYPLVQYLKQTELDTIIFQRFGPIGMRIVRILTQKGKLEDKQIQKLGLIRIVDVRTKLLEMQMAGFVDIQELAKDTRQTHASMMFLWFFDAERVTTIVREHIYKAISRCLQLLNSEKREALEVLELADRTDIRGYEELLPPHYLKALHSFRNKEEKILTQISRLDDLVGIFVEF